MTGVKQPVVTIRYKTSHGDVPLNINIIATDPLEAEHLPELLATNYKFIGWVHVNSAGYESSLSERMILSNDWLIPTDIKNNEYQITFTAKWRNDKKSGTGTGELYDGDYVVIPKVTEQSLPTAEKFMEEDVTVKSIPYFDVSNAAGGSSVYIGTEV